MASILLNVHDANMGVHWEEEDINKLILNYINDHIEKEENARDIFCK